MTIPWNVIFYLGLSCLPGRRRGKWRRKDRKRKDKTKPPIPGWPGAETGLRRPGRQRFQCQARLFSIRPYGLEPFGRQGCEGLPVIHDIITLIKMPDYKLVVMFLKPISH